MTQHDTTLLQHWATRRDAEAFNEIVVRYLDLVYGTCKRVLGNEADAEDVTQECFIRLAQDPGQVRSSVGGWLHRLATHRSRDFLKAESRRRRREEQFVGELHETAEAEWDDVQAFVDEAIERLPRMQRRVIIAHFLQRKTHEGIARELGVTRPAVSYHIQKGVENLRKFLQNRGIKVSAATLLTAPAASMAKAAPAHLASKLGKLALAGTSNSATTWATLFGGALVMKTVVVGSTAIILGVFALWAFLPQGKPLPVLDRADNVAGVQEQAAIQASNASQASSPSEPEFKAAWADQPDNGGAVPPATSPPADASDDQGKGETTGGTVEGVVVDQHDVPIENAPVFLQRRPEDETPFNEPPVALTAQDGSFRADNVPLDLSTIYADHPDYSPGWTAIRPGPERAQSVRIVLTAGGTVEGRVTIGGQPSSGSVAASLHAVVRSANADHSGSYRLERITPGVVDIVAFVTRHRSMSRTAIVEPEKTTVVDFDFPEVPAILEGHVTMEGAPVPSATLSLSVSTAADAYETYCTATGPDGFYRFENLPAGEASMAAYSTGKNGPSRRRSVSFEIASEGMTVQDVDLTVGNCVVSGRIDIPRNDCHGAVCILDGQVALEEFTASALTNLDSLMVAHTYKMNGTYRFDGLEPGTYTLLVIIYPDDVDSTSDSMGQALVATEVVRLEESQEEVVELWPLPVQ